LEEKEVNIADIDAEEDKIDIDDDLQQAVDTLMNKKMQKIEEMMDNKIKELDAQKEDTTKKKKWSIRIIKRKNIFNKRYNKYL